LGSRHETRVAVAVAIAIAIVSISSSFSFSSPNQIVSLCGALLIGPSKSGRDHIQADHMLQLSDK
jgi:hypothetical protein